MKKRIKVFETNSSSSHVLSIAKTSDKIDQTIKPKNGVVEIVVGEYGWDFETFYSAEEKASYVATAIMNDCPGKLDLFIEVMKKATGAKTVKILPLSGEYKYKRTIKMFDHLSKQVPGLMGKGNLDKVATKASQGEEEDWGYIDHQSSPGEELDWEIILDSDSGMEKFIFSSKSYFKTGNDNV